MHYRVGKLCSSLISCFINSKKNGSNPFYDPLLLRAKHTCFKLGFCAPGVDLLNKLEVAEKITEYLLAFKIVEVRAMLLLYYSK